jgi:hypothetical protein
MENIETFKKENEDFLLHHSFQDQKVLRSLYDAEIDYTLMQMRHYLEDVQHVREQNMDIAIISHLTYNLNHQLLHCYYRSDEFYEATFLFLTGDDDEKNYKYLEEFQKIGKDIKELIENFNQISLFEIYQSRKSIVYEHPQLKIGIEGRNASLLKLERELAYMNGVQLVKCLVYLIGFVEKLLISIKNGNMFEPDEELEYVYDLNYVYYADNYWDKEHFRHLVETNYFIGEVTDDGLTTYYRDLVRDFESNRVGNAWKNNSDNRGQMAYELLRLSINSDQWEYFFKNVFAIEELKRWVNELRNPKKPITGLRSFVVKQEIADAVIHKISSHVNLETKPKSIVMPIRAAMDAGVMHRPSWEAFLEEYGSNKISSKSSFNSYTNPLDSPYKSASYQTLVEEFKNLLE